MYNIVTAGIVDDPRVVMVAGTAVNGDTKSAAQVNSCWFLVVVDTNVANGWEVVEAQDSADSPLCTLTFK